VGCAQIRLYRVRWFFEHLEYNLTVSLLWSTLVRNMMVRMPAPCPIFFLLEAMPALCAGHDLSA
jgi:hypothetical protein